MCHSFRCPYRELFFSHKPTNEDSTGHGVALRLVHFRKLKLIGLNVRRRLLYTVRRVRDCQKLSETEKTGRFVLALLDIHLNSFYTHPVVTSCYSIQNVEWSDASNDGLQWEYSISYKANEWCGGKSIPYNFWCPWFDSHFLQITACMKWTRTPTKRNTLNVNTI